MRINALGNTATDFASDDYIALDGTTNGSRKMKNYNLLKATAQKALAGNVAPLFDPTKPNDEGGFSYYSGENVTYDGENYVFVVNHKSGSWNSSEVEQKPISETINLEGVGQAVQDWLDDHPEAVTTVLDNSITESKLAPSIKIDRQISSNILGYVLLDKNKSFASQVTENDTIYEIKDSFDLSGNTFNVPTGAIFKFNGGSIVNGVMVGELNVFGGVLHLYDIGIYSDTSKPETLSRFSILSGITNKVCLSLDYDINIGGTISLASFELLGNENSIYFSSNGGFDVVGDIIVKGVVLTNETGYSTRYAFRTPANTTGTSDIRFENCKFLGDLRVYYNDRTANNDGDGIGTLDIISCYGEGNKVSDGTNILFYVSDTLFDNISICDCKFKNFTCNIINTGTSGNPYKGIIAASTKPRSIVLRNSTFANDSDFDFSAAGPVSQTYYCVAVASMGRFLSENCIYENLLCNVSGIVTYDNYASCNYVEYRNNVWHNCINTTDVVTDPDNPPSSYNCFIKSKGASKGRIFADNSYILDILPNSGYYYNRLFGDDLSDSTLELTILKNNTFKSNYIYSNTNAHIFGDVKVFDGNTFEIDYINVFGTSGLFPATGIFIITNNVININHTLVASVNTSYVISATNAASGILKFEGNVCNCSLDGFLGVGSSYTTTDYEFVVKDNDISLTAPVFIERAKLNITFENNRIKNVYNGFFKAIDRVCKTKYFSSRLNLVNGIQFNGILDSFGNSESVIVRIAVSDGLAFSESNVILSKDSGGSVSGKLLLSDKNELAVTSSAYRVPYSEGELGIGFSINAYSGAFNISPIAKTATVTLSIFSAGNNPLKYPKSATTTQRNTWTTMPKGFVLYDETIRKNIVWNGTAWTNVDGSSLS